MNEYHKIQTVYRRDPETNFRTLLEGEYARPEFEYLAGCRWACEEKIDGTNIRVLLSGTGERTLEFRGKTDRAVIPKPLMAALEAQFTVEALSACFTTGDDVTLYGEGYGPKIQKGGELYRDDPGFILFDVRIGRWWLQRDDVQVLGNRLEIPVAPTLAQCTLPAAVDLCRSGITSVVANGRRPAEGLVIRPQVELQGRDGKRVITKIKAKDF